MKSLKPAIITVILSLIIIALLQSCKPKPGTWVNEKIPEDKRKEFHQLNDELLKILKANDPKTLENIMSKEFLETPGKNRLIELCSIRMREGKNELLDEYYIVHPTPEEISLKTFKYSINSYTLSYVPLTQERYMALFTVKYGVDKWLLTAIFNKYKYGWKIAELELEPYTVEGKTSPELFKQAQAEYDKGYLVNALNTMDLSRKCLMPNSVWRYDELDEMDAFYSKVLTETDKKYTFPIVIKQLPTQPNIFKIFNQDKGDGNYPMIYYVSKVSLKNESAVKAEHEAIKKVIGQVMPGIDRDKKYVYYTVFNEMPDWKKKKIEHLEIIDKY